MVTYRRIRESGNLGGRGCTVLFCLFFVFALSLSAAPRPWPHETSSVEGDGSLHFGNLENGFRYVLKPHHATPGRISMRFVVSVGSVDELEEERGLAHFVEHMAFAGTKNFPAGDLGRFFQALGMDFGGDVTAFTYHDRTVYHLELPNNDASLIEQSIRLFRDFADGILFEGERVEIERDVILREKQVRDSPSARLSRSSLEFAFQGSLLEDKSPIGTPHVLENCDKEDLRSFYQKWYRPDLMTLVIVGDFDKGSMEESIDSEFRDLAKPSEKLKDRDWGSVKEKKGIRAQYHEMPGMGRFHVEVTRAWSEKGRDSWKRREKDFYRSFSTELFNERCRLEIDEVRDDFAAYGRYLGMPQVNLTISAGGQSWLSGVVWLDRRLRQTHKYGFLDYEIEVLKEAWQRNSKHMVSRYNSLEPVEIIDEIVDSIEENFVYVGIEESFRFQEKMLEEVNPQRLKEAFRESWNLDRLKFVVAGDKNEEDIGLIVSELLKQDRKLKLPEYEIVARSHLQFSPTDGLGSVESSDQVEGIEDAYSFQYSNNLRLTFMNTPFLEGEANALVRIGGGMLEFDCGNPATHEIGLNAFFRTGFGEYDMEQIYSDIRENLDSFSFSVAEHDAFEFRGSGDADALSFFFKMLTEYLKDPQISEEAFLAAKLKYKQMRLLEPDGVQQGYRELQKMLFPGAAQFHEPTFDEIDSARLQDAHEWLVESFREGFLEVVIVGDLEKEFVTDLISNSLGSLPKHKENKDEFEAARQLSLEVPVGHRKIEYDELGGENAFVVVAWDLQDHEIEFRENACLFAFSQILENRFHEKVRQNLGKSYSPMVNYEVYPAYDTLRFFRADIDCLREDAQSVLTLVHQITDELLKEGLADDEVARSIIPLEDRIVGAWRDNDFLANMVFSGMYEYKDSIKYALAYRDGLLGELTPDEIIAAARKYLKGDRCLSVAIMPGTRNPITEYPGDYRNASRAGLN